MRSETPRPSRGVCAALQGEFPFSRPSDHTAINAAARMQMQFHRILRAQFHIKKLYVRIPAPTTQSSTFPDPSIAKGSVF